MKQRTKWILVNQSIDSRLIRFLIFTLTLVLILNTDNGFNVVCANQVGGNVDLVALTVLRFCYVEEFVTELICVLLVDSLLLD